MLPVKSFTAGTRMQPAIHPLPSFTSASISANHSHPTRFKPFDEKKFAHRRTDLNPQSWCDFIAAPSRACTALASLLAIVHCAGDTGRLLHGALSLLHLLRCHGIQQHSL